MVVAITEYDVPDCPSFVMGVTGALLVTLFADFIEYMPGRNRNPAESRFVYYNWSYPLCS